MQKISGRAKVDVQLTITLTLTKREAKALDAIVGYGIEPFLKVFYEKLGKSYLEPYEKEARSLFKTVDEQLKYEILKIEEAELKIAKALEKF